MCLPSSLPRTREEKIITIFRSNLRFYTRVGTISHDAYVVSMEGIKTSYVDLHLNTLEVGYSSDYGEQRYVPEIILEVSNNPF